MRAGPTYFGSARIRSTHRGLDRPTSHNLCGLQSLVRPAPHLTREPTGWLVFFFFFLIFMIKLSMFKNWETLRSSQN